MNSFIYHLGILLVFPPLLLGVIGKTKAFFAGRWGPPLLQGYYDIFKLGRKQPVYSVTTNWIFRMGPMISTAAILAAGIVLPISGLKAPVQFGGDMILFVYLLALSRFFMVLAALDTGSSFEGMGASREATFACLSEITIFLNLAILALLSKSLSLSGIFLGGLSSSWGQVGPVLILVVVSFFLVLLCENSRIPVDDPETHLELTMIHEVMVLDHSAAELALIVYGQALKLFLFGCLIVSMIFSFKIRNIAAEAAFFTSGFFGLGIAIGIVESAMARLRLNRVLYVLYAAFIFSIFAFIVILVRGHA
ncbi:MAG: NADH-quinone oxidoreductase subunit H [Candidatus Omnitrophica bacterium]|nr:NADH-quinone oxidoreductase subunit H [Candidatus Omnitrophota bacterium]MDE2008605.1 NADH-quinone oxidoreductase subunit H [Candidatus Omnitrophota bacterium]MDE2214071.1 NADH-quinone oxidoreductase subunit H [Candidatus Omnitrophota bacterium]MDE2230951.1 NADH-quinone oxidoreductase subunit H [Candidatus Omnitrophota bacterium]